MKDFAEADDILSSSDSILLNVSILKGDACFQRPAIIPLVLISTSAHAFGNITTVTLDLASSQDRIGQKTQRRKNFRISAFLNHYHRILTRTI